MQLSRPADTCCRSDSPGGTVDMIARLVAQGLSERLGRQVVVDNRPGAGTIIGSEIVAKAPPDSYTLLMSVSTLAINPAVCLFTELRKTCFSLFVHYIGLSGPIRNLSEQQTQGAPSQTFTAHRRSVRRTYPPVMSAKTR